MSTLEVSNITDGTDTVETGYVVNGSAKAWLTAQADTTLDSSFNISGGVDNGTGNYTYTFTSSFADSYHVGAATCQTGYDSNTSFTTPSSSTATVLVWQTNGTSNDKNHYCIFQGDLA